MGDRLLLLLDQINMSSSMSLLWMTSGFTQFTGVTLCTDLSMGVNIFDSLGLAVLFFLLCLMWCSVRVSWMLSFFNTLNLVMLFSLMVCGLISSRFRFFKLRVSVWPSTGSFTMGTDVEGEAIVSSNLSLSFWELMITRWCRSTSWK